MPVADTYVLHAIKFASPAFELTQLESADPQSNSNVLTQYSAGDPYPMFRAIGGQEPKLDFTTGQLATLLTNCGLLGVDLSGGNTDLHYKLVTDFGARDETTGVRFRIAQAMMYWTSITLPHGGNGSASVVIQPTYDGTNPPIVPAAAAAVGTKQAAQNFGAGAVLLNGTALDGVKNITINSGFRAILEAAETETWPTLVAVEMVDPVIEVQSLTLGAWETYGLAGTALSGNGVEAYGRKKLLDGHNSTGNDHLKFSGTKGIILPISGRAGNNNRALAGFRIPLRSPSAGTSPLTIATNAAHP